MLRCAFCGRALKETAAWKGRGERYYCNDFCAEAEEFVSYSGAAQHSPARDDRNVDGSRHRTNERKEMRGGFRGLL